MARQLTPEALRFIQLHYSEPPETDAYEDAETIIDSDRPFYESAQTLVEPRRALYLVPDLPEPAQIAAAVETAETDLYDSWLHRPEAPAVPARPGLWQRLMAALRRLLRRE